MPDSVDRLMAERLLEQIGITKVSESNELVSYRQGDSEMFICDFSNGSIPWASFTRVLEYNGVNMDALYAAAEAM